jgi:lipoprotein-releasing system ATP-binding protein
MLEIHEVSKEYPTPGGKLRVLAGVTLTLPPGDSAAIVGPSGSGKSTLLYIVGGLEAPSSGTVRLDGRNPFELDEKSLALFRNEEIGFVFQDHHLLPQCSVLENVLIPALAARDGQNDFEQRARDLLDKVGLGKRLLHRPSELSGGEKQRVALARALIMNPRLLLCDEPTGNLDAESTETVASLLLELHHSRQAILILVTHNLELAARLARIYRLTAGQLIPA